MRSVYVASPLGFSETTRGYYVTLLGSLNRAGFAVLDPWAEADGIGAEFTAAERLDGTARLDALRAINARLGAANAEAIRICDCMLAVLDGVDVDSGTAAEIGFAAALGKPVVGLRLDFRRTGDNDGSVVNLQVEHFLTGPVHRSLPAALSALTHVA